LRPQQNEEVTVPVLPVGVCCPLLKVAVLLDVSENTAHVAALQSSYFGMPTLDQVFLISEPGHFDRTTLGNDYRSSCADRWGGAAVWSTGRAGAVAALPFPPAKQHLGLQP